MLKADLHKVLDKHTLRINEISISKWYILNRKKVVHFEVHNDMNYTLPLREMSLSDKLQAMEAIWMDLSNHDSGYVPPQWHNEILKERQKRIYSGDISFTDWEVAKKEIRERIS